MFNKKNYKRLSMIFVFLIFGFSCCLTEAGLLPEREKIIYCEEFKSYITCDSMLLTKQEANHFLNISGIVLLRGAVLLNGFHHPVVTLGHSKLTFVDGKVVALPPTDGGIKMLLDLPPKIPTSLEKSYVSCEINPYGDGERWAYSCAGGVEIPGGFYFQNEETNYKFQEARKLIEKLRNSN